MEHLAAINASMIDTEEISSLEKEISNLKDKIFAKLREKNYNEQFLTNYFNNESKQEPDTHVHSRFRVRKTFIGHHGRIQDISWSEDGRRLVSAAQDGRLLTWNTETTNKRNLITLKSPSVLCCSYSSNNTHIASGGFDSKIHVFNTSIDNIENSIHTNEPSTSNNNNGATHRTIGSNQNLINAEGNQETNNNDNNNNGGNNDSYWEIDTPSVSLSNHEGYVSGVEFLKNENSKLLSCSGDSCINLWDITNEKSINTFKGHSGDVMALSQNPNDNNLFVSVGIYAQSKIWDLRINSNNSSNETSINNTNNNNNNNTNHTNLNMQINMNKQQSNESVNSTSNNNKNIDSNKGCVGTLINRNKDNSIDETDIQDVSWFPDGNSFINGNDNGKIRLFDIRMWSQINEYFLENYNEKPLEAVSQIDFTKGGRYIIAGYCGCEPYCLVWNTLSAQIETEMFHTERASCLSVSPNGYSIMTGCWDNKIRMWA